MLDLLIRGAQLFDGLGNRARRADVGVRDGRVVAIDELVDAEARDVRDAAGLWLTPGFLDIHTHYDLEVELAPGLAESVRHGVTTVVMGHCSLSITMGEPRALADIFTRVENFPPALIAKWLERLGTTPHPPSAPSPRKRGEGSRSSEVLLPSARGEGARSADEGLWSSPREYFDHLRALPLGPNVAPMLGHSALRAQVMGLDRSVSEYATDDELRRMRALAEEALDVGCVGISVDMVPWHMMSGRLRGRTIPSQHADLREYRMLADVCRERDAVLQVTPNPQRPASFANILRLSLGGTKLPLRATVLSALDSAVDRRLWRLFPATLFVMNRLLGANLRFQTLTEPFTIYSDGPLTPLFEELPSGVRLNDCDTAEERRALWRDPTFRKQFWSEWLHSHRTFHRRPELMTIVRCPDSSLNGTTFRDLDHFIELLERYDSELRWVATSANDREQVRDRLLRHPHILPGFSDAGAHVRNMGYYDTALSLLRQSVTRDVMSPERAIARVTGEPAQWYGLDRGVIRIGARADLLLLRPAALRSPIAEVVEVEDPLLDDAPRLVKRGSNEIVESVYVGGTLLVRDGEPLPMLGSKRCGEVLRIATPAERVDTAARLRIDGAPHPFTDYWDVFVLKHRHPMNIALHVAGVVIWYGLLVAAIALRNPWLLLALPASQLIGLVGHALFERSHIDWRDAAFSLRATRCLNRMFVRVLSGRYARDVRERVAMRG